MVNFATQSGYTQRKNEISAAERLAQAAQMQQQNFENSQQDRARSDALDAAERKYYANSLGGGKSIAGSTVPAAPSVTVPSAAETLAKVSGGSGIGRLPATSPAPVMPMQGSSTAPPVTDPAMAFANVPGGGKLMAGIANMRREQEKDRQKRDDDAARNAAIAFREGDWALFDHFNKQANLKIPDADINRAKTDERFRRNMANAALGSEIYKANPQQAAKFFVSYMQATKANPGMSSSDAAATAIQSTGAPVDKVDWSLKELHDGTMVRMNLMNGEVKPVTMTDQATGKDVPVRGKGVAGNSRELQFQVRYNAYKKAFPNATEQDVLAFASGDKKLGSADPATRAKLYATAMQIMKDDIDFGTAPAEEKQRILDDLVNNMMGVTATGNNASPASATGAEAARITSQADFDALPSGAMYINPADGETYRKN